MFYLHLSTAVSNASLTLFVEERFNLSLMGGRLVCYKRITYSIDNFGTASYFGVDEISCTLGVRIGDCGAIRNLRQKNGT